MNNKICLNQKARNHWKIMPATESIKVPKEERSQLKWAESLVLRLQNDSKLKRHFIYVNRGYGYMIGVYELEDRYYLIHSIRNEFKSYNNVVYINDRNLDDLINIGKMMQANIKTIMRDYKDNMMRLRDDIIKGKVKFNTDA